MNKTCKQCTKYLSIEKFEKNRKICKQCNSILRYERRREKRIKQGLRVKFPTLASRLLLTEGKKYCPTCKEILNISEFSTTKKRSKIATHCKQCSNFYAKKRQEKTEVKDKKQKYYKKYRKRQLNNILMRKFGISLNDYNKLLHNQKGRCSICNKSVQENGKRLAVDHCHNTNKVRSLLCSSCNICIGFIEKNNLNIEDISNYLNKHKG